MHIKTSHLCLGAIGLMAAGAPSLGQINVVLTGTSGSALVDVSITGQAAFAFPFAFNPNSFQLQDFAFDPFNERFVGTPPPGFSITGTATNTTTNASVNVVTIQFDDDSDGTSDTLDDILINFDGNLNFEVGDSVLINASGTIDLSSIGATFDDLTLGSGTVGQNQIFAGGRLTIVPTPGAAALLALGGLAASRRRRG
ncbi:MAG: hypothetical protein ACTS27_00495 [Phycisphaerales bacterium]